MQHTVGLFALSASPYHVGHEEAVNAAAAQNDVLWVFVSTSDRARKGEATVKGEDKKRSWEFYEKIIPKNARVELGGSPVRKVWETLGEADKLGDVKTLFRIYGGESELAERFNATQLRKYVPGLFERGQVELVISPRTFSGSEMRQFIASKDRVAFIDHLPNALTTEDKEELCDIFFGTEPEDLLRDYVSEIVNRWRSVGLEDVGGVLENGRATGSKDLGKPGAMEEDYKFA